MALRRLLYIICFFGLLLMYSSISGCIKEYSYEREIKDTTAQRDSTITQDSSNNTSLILSSCFPCQQIDTNIQRWRFRIGNNDACGSVTGAVLSPDGDAMTFFGPSVCTEDTGIVITAFFDQQLLKNDQQNIVASRSALEYYDNTTGTNVLESSRQLAFTVTINNYWQQTKYAEGSFQGLVFTKNGSTIKIEGGRFKIKFR